MIFEGYGDHRGPTGHALVFFKFNCQRFDKSGCFLASKLSLKISGVGVRRFGGVREQTNKQTDSLTDWHFYRVIVDIKNKIWKGNSIDLCFKNFCFQTRLSSDVPLEHYHRKI